MMQNLLILDTETTGIDPKKGKLIEVAGIFFNIPSKSIIQQISTLFYAEDNAAQHINNITVESLRSVNPGLCAISNDVLSFMMGKCDAVIAHNANFDRRWVEHHLEQKLISQQKKWLCSKEDIQWAPSKSLKLVDIAEAMGVPVVSAHRALSDCQMLAACLAKLPDLDAQLNSGSSRKLYVANVSYEDKELPKKAGFYWDADRKKWFKKMRPEQAEACRFPISIF
jgi:DNA polymerase III subunit epsilon